MANIRRLETGSSVALHHTKRLLAAIWTGLTILLVGGTSAGAQAIQDPGPLPAPSNPSYESEILKLRAEDVVAIQHWRNSLETMNQLVHARESGVPLNDDRDLYGWQGQMEMNLLQAEAALARLEQQVRHDFHGQLPGWWPRNQA